MVEKKTEEFEKRMTSIKSTKPRMDLLEKLAYSYKNDIEDMHNPRIKNQEKNLQFKVPDQKADVEKIVAAIKKVVGNKYHLRYEVVCKVVDGNGLDFKLDFNEDTIEPVAKARKMIENIRSEQKKEYARLDAWKRKQMFNIANGKDFDEFHVR